jgi:hypothetical protein
MKYEIDTVPPEDEGDGHPNMQWRLRVILVLVVTGFVILSALLSLLWRW